MIDGFICNLWNDKLINVIKQKTHFQFHNVNKVLVFPCRHAVSKSCSKSSFTANNNPTKEKENNQVKNIYIYYVVQTIVILFKSFNLLVQDNESKIIWPLPNFSTFTLSE